MLLKDGMITALNRARTLRKNRFAVVDCRCSDQLLKIVAAVLEHEFSRLLALFVCLNKVDCVSAL